MSPHVLVVGGGNAGLCAAIAAREAGARVLLIEKDSRDWRGGNSKYTRNIRSASEQYPEAELLEDLVQVTGEATDLTLATQLVRQSRGLPEWMERHGVRWQPALHGTLQLDRTNRFFLGGGKALLNQYYRFAERIGVDIQYQTQLRQVVLEAGLFRSAVVETGGSRQTLEAAAVVIASGGFEANLEWLRRYLGDAVDRYAVRGTRSNDGAVIEELLSLGAAQRGDPRGFHAVAVDARSPRYDGGIVTRVDSIPFGIAVNRLGLRFHDEGEELWPKRYAVWGKLISEQADQAAYSIFDARAAGRFIPPAYPPFRSDSIGGLAEQLGLDPAVLSLTVANFNRHVQPGTYDPSRLDDCRTEGLQPPKSHWALPIDRPPFFAYPMRPGITFTYLGLAVDGCARVVRTDGSPFPNIFAAGEVMAGNVLSRGYLGGFGMTIGTGFGIVAGEQGARYAGAA